MEEKKENEISVSNENEDNKIMIQNLIYVIRGKQVMFDSDLAMLYQVETKALNRSMKRNEKRFPEDFCFQLTKDEAENLRCQFGTSSQKEKNYGGRRYSPYVYTEQGIAMLSAILRNDIAIEVSIRIMKTFVEMRKYRANNSLIVEKLNGLEQRQIEMDLKHQDFVQKSEEKFEQVFNYIETHKESNQKIFFEGQIFDAFSLMVELISIAENEIILIDGYIDIVSLNILAKKKENVKVIIYTKSNSRLSEQDILNFNTQFPSLEVKHTNAFHDRFLILDRHRGYHIGASIKDAGKKCFGINRIEDINVIYKLIEQENIKIK